MTHFTAPTVMDLAYLAMHMREDEKAQWSALTGLPYDAELCARGMAAIPGPSWCLVGDDGMPLVVAGLEPIRPGVYQAWMAGTPEAWVTHWRSITKHCRRVFADLFAEGAQRIQTLALESRKAAHVWYERGLLHRYEGTHAAYFADGQNAVHYAVTRDQWRAAHGQQQ